MFLLPIPIERIGFMRIYSQMESRDVYSILMPTNEKYRSKYPHIHPVGAMFFVTFRLADSLPQNIINQLKASINPNQINEYEHSLDPSQQIRYNRIQQYYFNRFDYQLDEKPYGDCYLKDPKIAQIVIDKLRQFDSQYYKLIAYCIMPNHVHLLIDLSVQMKGHDHIPENYKQLHQILKRIKGATAVYANRHLNREGTFWQKDSYDRYMRNGHEISSVINYILENPVKAGLVKHRSEWPYSFYFADKMNE